MPCWMLTCPKCSHKFTHTTIDAAAAEEARRDRSHVPLRPLIPYVGEARTCPNCKTSFFYQWLDLRYSEARL